MPLIEAANLRKIYRSRSRSVHALDGLDLVVEEGTVKGLLGPNGAGKTTTVKVLTTLLAPSSGSARIAGIDVLRHPEQVKRIIGASGQYAAVDEKLTGLENLEMVGRLYHLSRRAAKARARELIELFDLAEAGDRPVQGFSGGMRRRIDLAGALVIRPRILFLDEPTTGLDPRSRLALWDIIRELVSDGTTLLLTTQYLEEADQLADDIAVIDGGKVIAEGTADELKAQVGGHRAQVTLTAAADGAAAVEILARHGRGEVEAEPGGRTFHVAVDAGPVALQRILTELTAADVELHDAGIRRPTLDDVFMRLTGHRAEETSQNSDPEAVAETSVAEPEAVAGDGTGRVPGADAGQVRPASAAGMKDTAAAAAKEER